MGFASFIAYRHIFARKSHSAINIISSIAMGGVAISTAALVVVLSVFNGIESLVGGMYSSLDTDLAIIAAEGKGFRYGDSLRSIVEGHPRVVTVGRSLREDALFGYQEQQQIGMLVGVDHGYLRATQLPSHTADGKFDLYLGTMPIANVGAGMAYYLRLSLAHLAPITIYLPDRMASNWLNPATAFKQKTMTLGAVLSVNADFDEVSVVVPIEVAQEMLALPSDYVSALSLQLAEGSSPRAVQRELQEELGSRFRVQSRQQQNEALYRTMKSERFIIIIILGLILFIATFNVVGSLSMLMIDKKADIATLSHMGARAGQIRSIFVLEGLIISLGGAFIGIALGLALCWAHATFGLISLGEGAGFVVDMYPVEVRWPDLVFVFALAGSLGLLASWIPVRLLRPTGGGRDRKAKG